jgi:hypothetical protein
MAADECSPKNINKVFKKLKFKTSGRVGVRRSTIKAKGIGTSAKGDRINYTIVLELMLDPEGLWIPMPDEGSIESWHLCKSHMHSYNEIDKCTTRKMIKSREDISAVLTKIAIKRDPALFD